MTYASEVLADSPLLYWRLGETSGTVAADASGNGRTGTYAGSPTLGVTGLQASDSDKAASFDGVNDIVSGAAPATTSGFTIELIFKNLTAGTVIANRYPSSTSDRVFYLGLNSGRLSMIIKNAAGTEATMFGTTLVGSATTRHVAVTYDGSITRFYLDGTADGTSTAVTGPIANVIPTLEVGGRSAASAYTNATFDEVALYGTALSSTRIAAHRAAMTAPAPITIHPNMITSTSTVRAPSIVPYVAPVDGNITITAELAPARWSAAATQPNRSAEVQPARLTAGVKP